MPRYVISNSNKTEGGVYTVDSRSGAVERVYHGPSRGLTRGPDGLFYMVSGYRNPEDGVSTVYRMDPSTWKPEPVAQYPLGDCHDLRWFQGHLYLVASVGNQVVRLDENCQMVDRLQIVHDEADVCHANCLTEFDGSLYCSIFTLTPGERKEKRLTGAWHTEGKILKLDWERKSYEIFYEPLAQPHSMVVQDGGVYLVESHTSSLTRVDLATRTSRRLGQYYGFVRGLAVGPDEAVMGVCVMQQKDRRRRKVLPWHLRLYERYFPFSGLFVLDTKSWKIRRRIPIPHGEVYDVHRLHDGEGA